MRMLRSYSLPVLIAGSLLVSGCASSQMGEGERLAQANVQNQGPADPPACQSKWVAAGNNSAKADRYFQVSC
jgi:hypothetical protein